ncbi:MAG: glycoside hydrolase [Bacteroidales bacterium]|nr:glycoside hydrolase [Bacteroidales bacterium]
MKYFYKHIACCLLFLWFGQTLWSQDQLSTSLNGKWLIGENRVYDRETEVPGIATDPAKINAQQLWYKKILQLPNGHWEYATLELKGARFQPEVYIDGRLVSKKGGGMATTFHLLDHKNMRPGKKVTIEIALAPLNKVSPEDASYIPIADQWRSNISSSLWDDVVLHLHGKFRIKKIVSSPDIVNKKLSVKYSVEELNTKADNSFFSVIDIYDCHGKKLISETKPSVSGTNEIEISYKDVLKEWSPDNPNLYKLSVSLYSGKKIIDKSEVNLGIKEFSVKEKQFYLNGKPCKLRGGTVVWHRWVRSEEGRILGYDTSWFTENIIQRLKEHGANYIRFHLGVPPERLLDLCDKYGLLVQYEWSFFHGMPATKESCVEQYEQWLTLAMKHPSVAIYHPYNETEGEQLEIVWQALNEVLPSYPSLVLSERDVTHIHKYWWSLFENLGLYYDSYEQFDKAIMVDEFGGNYLDEKGDMGGYKSIPESYMRFLGHNHTTEMRLKHLALSNGKIGEYWRRIGAAGVSPFCMLSSWEDGNTWFMGKLQEGNPKSVWNALTSLWSPISVSLNIWDVNFAPGSEITLPIHLFNDTDKDELLKVKITIEDRASKIHLEQSFVQQVEAFSTKVLSSKIQLPNKVGSYVIKAKLANPPKIVKYPVVSDWEIRIYKATVDEKLKKANVFIPDFESELLSFAKEQKLNLSKLEDKQTNTVLISRKSWDKLTAGNQNIINFIEEAIGKGISVVMLDVGERNMGQGYPVDSSDLGPLQGVARITDPIVTNYTLFGGITLTFKEEAEPETHFFASGKNGALYNNLPMHYSGMWNGWRGGLTVPAADIEISGLNQDAFIRQWEARGADPEKIRANEYYVFELQGFYEFSTNPRDTELQKKLRAKVVLLVEDAPALASSINPNTPIKATNLNSEYKKAKNGIAENLTVLANSGKNLTRTPVILIDFDNDKGKLIISQLLTAGRLSENYGTEGLYGVRYDETAVQVVLNMLSLSISKE